MLALILIMIVGYLLSILVFNLTSKSVVIYFLNTLGIPIDPVWISSEVLAESINSDVKPARLEQLKQP